MKDLLCTTMSAVSIGLLCAGPAAAQIELSIDQADSAAVAGSVAQVLNVHTTSDWTVAAIVIELDAGSIIQDRYFAADEKTDASGLDIPLTATATGAEGFGKPVTVAGASDRDLGGKVLWLDGKRMDLCWYNNSPGDIGWGRIGRFTFSGDAVGKWTLAVMQSGDDVRYVFGGKIIHGKLKRDGLE